MKDSDAASMARAAFAKEVAVPEHALNLARAALWIAAEEYPSLDVDSYLATLDDVASAIRDRLPAERYPMRVIRALNSYLFDILGFHGNSAEYYDPRNSFLNQVIDRRRGIPITLSVVVLEVGWRLGLPLEGVGFPGHFLVKYVDSELEVLIDPFHKGEVLVEVDFLERLQTLYGPDARVEEAVLQSVSKRQILTRMLNNLRAIYLHLGDVKRAHGVVDRLLILHPDSPPELRERGMLALQLQRVKEAVADLERYLAIAPDARDAAPIRQIVDEARRWRPLEPGE